MRWTAARKRYEPGFSPARQQMGHLLRKAQLDWNTVVRRGMASRLCVCPRGYPLRDPMGSRPFRGCGSWRPTCSGSIPLATDLAWPKSFAGWHEKQWTRYHGRESEPRASRRRLTAAVGVLGADISRMTRTTRRLFRRPASSPPSHRMTFGQPDDPRNRAWTLSTSCEQCTASRRVGRSKSRTLRIVDLQSPPGAGRAFPGQSARSPPHGRRAY